MSTGEKFILLAEDDPVVAELLLHVFHQQLAPPRIVHVVDGVEALDFLHSRATHARREPGNPTLVLLDVKMPRLDGLEVLRHIKTDPELRAIPVVMLTSSHDERDIRTSYERGANAYVVKPLEFHRLVDVLGTLETFWIEINQPPPQRENVPGVVA